MAASETTSNNVKTLAHDAATPAAPASKGPSAGRRIQQQTKDAFSRLFDDKMVRRILGKDAVTASQDGRQISLDIEQRSLLDPRSGRYYISNDIRTSRYTIWDFIPKQIFFQFTRIGNFYFLCVGIPQTIPGLSTTGSYTTILPLLFFVLLTVFKEGYDDYRRHRLDKVENANFATILGTKDHYTGKVESTNLLKRWNPFLTRTKAKPRPLPDEEFHGVRWVPTRWNNIKVGDILRLSRDEPVPADIVLLHSNGENNLAYIETMALDGETNLKSKQVSHALKGCDTIEAISRCKAEFAVEDPNPDLFTFNGRVTVNGEAVPLTLNEIVYRGSVLRNTTCAIGLVVNTGEECKIRLNSNQHPKAKKPALERVVNRVVISLAAYILILSVGLSMGYVRWQKNYERHAWYLAHARVPFHEIIIAFIIMFNNVVPLALYVSLEIVKIGQLLMLNGDIEMYDEETDTPARCNTNTILENLGQVGYIFSDKTGTLTDNVMKFRKISVAGTIWLHQMDMEEQTEADVKADDMIEELSEAPSSQSSLVKVQPVAVVIPEEQTETIELAAWPRPSVSRKPSSQWQSTGRPSMGRRSSSMWRSTGRPDHVQPEVTTTDMLEYTRLRPNATFSNKVKDYILAMALCHTCLPEHRDGKIELQASSPDELALVGAARELGYHLIHRTSQSITLELRQPDGQVQELRFDILDVIEFSSARKRMSIVVRYPDGRISVICKGADSAILPRLKMSSLAMQKATEVKKSVDLERQLYRRSEQQEFRNSFGGRPSLTIRRNPNISRDKSPSQKPAANRSKSFEVSRTARPSMERSRPSLAGRGMSHEGRHSLFLEAPVQHQAPLPSHLDFVEEAGVDDESETFTKCFRHLDDFATEGLRTLLYAQKFVSEQEYAAWKKTYSAATTSLVDRQERIEEAADKIEETFDLIGASAIEDKLQKGVPETIDRLRRANIKIWMLTGDKRETAINIAHSARICRPGSDLYILDVTKGALDSQLEELTEDLTAGSIHSVVVIDGHTLATVQESVDLAAQFYAVMIKVDSVICCRASPAQKALLVRTMRTQLKAFRGSKRRGLTLAIGDGANDLAMIQASHVGIGISGKEGLQAARVADYAIAQFRFLQRLLLVHGRWNYVRTAKFILCTFWKEMFFYLPTALYQRYTGYTGTSLYESTSLTVFNTLFTSLGVICMGIWEQDLSAETLLAVPELYIYGQRNRGLNLAKFTGWMMVAAVEGIVAWYTIWAGYAWKSPFIKDEGLYAIGTLAFTVGVLWINWKLFIFETHSKSAIVMFCFFLTTWGWFAWLALLNVAFPKTLGVYQIPDGLQHWGSDATWWSTLFITLGFLGMIQISLKIFKRTMQMMGLWKFPPWRATDHHLEENAEELDLELWQEMEQDPLLRDRLRKLARDRSPEEEEEDEEKEDEEELIQEVVMR